MTGLKQEPEKHLIDACLPAAAAPSRDAVTIQRLEAELRRARLAAIVESSHDAIIGKTLEGVVTSWNAGAERLYGYTAEEAVGRNITFLAPPERIGELEPIFAQLRRGERVMPFETVRVRKDGTRLDILLTVSPILDGNGRIAEASAIAHDITAQKRTEAALHEEARRKDELLAMLGHELRNPLATIRNGLAILERPGLQPEQARRARQTLDRQVQHLTRLVDDLLDLSRISRGKILLQTGSVDLVALVLAAVEDHRAAAASAGETLDLDLQDHPLRVAGDPIRLAQCVGNLLHNAVKFTAPGGRIDVSVRAEDGQAIVSVRDTGAGMSPETLARLFEPFSQADGGIDRSRGGLGLGLALVKRLVELHGGTATAHSEGLGRGTRVEIRLHLLPEDGEEPAPAPPLPGDGRRRARRCLVIEDNADAAETLGMLLELFGHQVRVVHDGRQGLEEARRFKPEAVLCDIGLPGGLDGYEVARRMRQDPVLRNARLVALTGYGQEEDQRRAREAGFDIHLTKPADPETLERLLAELP
jgi:two-component system CheB/CheR fusion protein